MGSITIDRDLMDAADIVANEKVTIAVSYTHLDVYKRQVLGFQDIQEEGIVAGNHVMLLRSQQEARRALEDIGVDPGAYPYLLPKARFFCIKLKDISYRAANIIKQEMLSKGGEAAVSRQAISCEGSGDIILMGTLKQYHRLGRKLRVQPLGLKKEMCIRDRAYS